MPLTRRIVPCLDVAGGRVVKGTRFASTRDAGDPVELARRYGGQGADELVFLDITASEERRRTIRALVSDVARVLDIPFTVGGGVSEVRHARDILLSGADKVAVNTGAVRNPPLLTGMMGLFGRQCVVVAVDAKRNYDLGGAAGDLEGGAAPDADGGGGSSSGGGGSSSGSDADGACTGPVNIYRDAAGRPFWFEVHVYGGKRPAGLDAVAWAARAQRLGAGEILLTSIDRDGTKDGYDLELTRAVSRAVGVPVVASGGCGRPEHMAAVLGGADAADAALAASIFHYDSHGIMGVKRFLRKAGIAVRM